MALTVLAFMLLWKVDLASIVRAKDRAQTAGDMAALAGARWQAASLNLIGEMNLLHALAAVEADGPTCELLEGMQIRMCFAGPIAGLLAMQQAAKQNRIHVNKDFTDYMKAHAETVRTEYKERYPEPWEGAWEDYFAMLDAVIADGIAAAPDNARIYSEFNEPHILADKAFYRAVNASNWCWFFLHYGNPLEWYESHSSWPELPPSVIFPEDCEFLGLRLQRISAPMNTIVQMQKFMEQADEMKYRIIPSTDDEVMEKWHTWMVYQPWAWGEWTAIHEDDFPIRGEVKDEFNYAGADIVARVHDTSTRLGNKSRGGGDPQVDEIVWGAAAKPFGFLKDGSNLVPPTLAWLVLPAFRAVRLIPVDAASEGSAGGFDLAFHRHVHEHLPIYLATGRLHAGCRYCSSIATFEENDYRTQGKDWLREHSGLCTLPPPSTGGHGGGTQIGH